MLNRAQSLEARVLDGINRVVEASQLESCEHDQ